MQYTIIKKYNNFDGNKLKFSDGILKYLSKGNIYVPLYLQSTRFTILSCNTDEMWCEFKSIDFIRALNTILCEYCKYSNRKPYQIRAQIKLNTDGIHNIVKIPFSNETKIYDDDGELISKNYIEKGLTGYTIMYPSYSRKYFQWLTHQIKIAIPEESFNIEFKDCLLEDNL